jgi:hypothetical protein
MTGLAAINKGCSVTAQLLTKFFFNRLIVKSKWVSVSPYFFSWIKT